MKINNFNIVIYAPEFVYSSGGTIALYELAKTIQTFNINVKIFDHRNKKFNNPIFNDYATLEDVNENTVVIYPEIEFGNPLKANHVVRLILCELGIHCPSDIYKSWNKNDLIYHWSTYNPKKKIDNVNILYCTYINPDLKDNKQPKQGYCHIIRKGYKFHKPLQYIHPSDSYFLPDYLSQEQLIEIFNQKKYLICYDPYTFNIFIAALCGCIPIVVPIKGVSKDEWLNSLSISIALKEKCTELKGVAYGIEEINYAERTLSEVREQLETFVNHGKTSVLKFINDLHFLFQGLDIKPRNPQIIKALELFEQNLLGSISFSIYPLISIILPVYNPKAKYLREAIESVINQTYPHWELCIADDASTKPYVRDILIKYAQKDNRIKVVFRQENGHISRASNTALEIATGEYIALLDHDDLLASNALYEVVKLLNEHPEADMIYSDEVLFDDEYIFKPVMAKSDWCPDSFLSSMYTCHLGVYRTSLVKEIGGFRVGVEGSQDYDLVLRFTEKTDKIFHIPKLLYYWRKHSKSTNSNYQAKPYAYEAAKKVLEEALQRRGEKGVVIHHKNVKGFYEIRYEITNYDLVSIIIPTRDLGDILDRCLESIFSKTTYPNYEVILIDNGSQEKETFDLIDKWKKQEPDRFKCYQYNIPFNYSQINNYAVTKAKGKYLLFLNNDTEVITPDWINAMVEQAQRQSIGAVGAYLKYPDNTMQHTGIILGRGILAANEHIYYDKILNFSAVTGACLMCRRDVFVEVGGFDEDIAVAFNDVDLCLKIREQGYYNICLPHVLLYHHESKTRGYEDTPEKIARFEREAQFMRDKWGALVEQDPCISPAYLGNPKKDQQVRANFTVIVPWWDHTEFLELWQNNLKILKDAEIIFIDNGSQEESKKALAEFCQKHSLKLIRNEENLGFSATNNQGLKKATKEYILHLNNDISINYLPFVYLAYLSENGIVGPGPAKNELNVSYVEGWGLCAKKSVLENLGGWDEEFDDRDWADLDLCYRAKLAGYPLFAIPEMAKWLSPVS